MSTTFSLSETAALRLLERCPSPVYLYDLREQRNLYTNREITDLLGYTFAELQELGEQLWLRLMHPEDLPRVYEHQQRIQSASDADVLVLEYRMRHKDGRWRWLQNRDVVYARLPDGRVQQFMGVVEDITEQRAQLAWYERALAIVPLTLYIYDLQQQRNVYANGQIGRLLGYTQEEILALGEQVWSHLLHPDDLPEVQALHQHIRTATDNETVEINYRMRRRDGSWAWLQDHVRVFLRDADGAVAQYIGATQDVSAGRQADAEREQLQQEVILAQQATLRELSTPLIPVNDDVLVMPLIGTIDSLRAQQIVEALLQGVSEKRARTVIVDITGVQIVDTHVASALVRAAQAVQLLGANTILTGIRPEVAQTLVQMGADLRALTTRSTLQSGIAFALKK